MANFNLIIFSAMFTMSHSLNSRIFAKTMSDLEPQSENYHQFVETIFAVGSRARFQAPIKRPGLKREFSSCQDLGRQAKARGMVKHGEDTSHNSHFLSIF